jgi:hypothetical protein
MPLIVNAPMLAMRRPIRAFRTLHFKDRFPRKIAELPSEMSRLGWIGGDGALTTPGSKRAERSLRLVGVVAPAPRRATSTLRNSLFVIRYSIFCGSLLYSHEVSHDLSGVISFRPSNSGALGAQGFLPLTSSLNPRITRPTYPISAPEPPSPNLTFWSSYRHLAVKFECYHPDANSVRTENIPDQRSR